jgi:hypothetical protein
MMNSLQPLLANGLTELVYGSDRADDMPKIFFKLLTIL